MKPDTLIALSYTAGIFSAAALSALIHSDPLGVVLVFGLLALVLMILAARAACRAESADRDVAPDPQPVKEIDP